MNAVCHDVGVVGANGVWGQERPEIHIQFLST